MASITVSIKNTFINVGVDQGVSSVLCCARRRACSEEAPRRRFLREEGAVLSRSNVQSLANGPWSGQIAVCDNNQQAALRPTQSHLSVMEGPAIEMVKRPIHGVASSDSVSTMASRTDAQSKDHARSVSGIVQSETCADKSISSDDIRGPTTLMIRNIPNRCGQRKLMSELEALGFQSKFDFVYVPLDHRTMSNVGYAFVNFIDADSACHCMEALENHRLSRQKKVLKFGSVSVAHIQGLEANMRQYERSAVSQSRLRRRRPLVLPNGVLA